MHTRNHIQIGPSFLIWGALSSPNLDIRGTDPPRLRVSDFAAGSPLSAPHQFYIFVALKLSWVVQEFRHLGTISESS